MRHVVIAKNAGDANSIIVKQIIPAILLGVVVVFVPIPGIYRRFIAPKR